jgi:hypothetical protein
MPFLRSATARTSTTHTSTLRAARARAVALAVGCVAVLAAVAPSPAHAELAPTPRLVDDALPARALPPTPTPDAATFCPRPTGRWWDDYAVRGCIELLAGRDHTTPITDRELAWLDLGGLPAYPTVDVDAIGEAIAAFEQGLADEAAEEEARLAAEAAAARGRRATPARGRAPGGSGSGGSDDFFVDRESAVYEACHERTPRPDDSVMIGGAEWDAFFRSVAVCVDREIPGYLARWTQQEAERQARFEEGLRREAEARARLDARVEAAKVQAAATCPGGWTVSYFGWMVSSYDEIEVTITCH